MSFNSIPVGRQHQEIPTMHHNTKHEYQQSQYFLIQMMSYPPKLNWHTFVKQMQTSSGASSLVAHSSASQLFVELIGLLLAKILFMIGGSLLVPALLNLIEDTQCDTV